MDWRNSTSYCFWLCFSGWTLLLGWAGRGIYHIHSENYQIPYHSKYWLYLQIRRVSRIIFLLLMDMHKYHCLSFNCTRGNQASGWMMASASFCFRRLAWDCCCPIFFSVCPGFRLPLNPLHVLICSFIAVLWLFVFYCNVSQVKSRSWGYKTFFMLNSAEHEILPAHKYENANCCWHFHIY